MSCFLFFSYATGDDPEVTRHKRQFYDDLSAQIFKHPDYDGAAPNVGFLDAEMPTGTEWQPELAKAIQTCRAFVYLQEQAYFNFKERPWCGREWHVFRKRLDAQIENLATGAERPPLMIPVIWKLMPRLPGAATAVQFQHRHLGEVYPRLGLYAMKSRPENNSAYVTLVTKLAAHIVKTANAHKLPPSGDLPSFQDIPDPFAPETPQEPLREVITEGPRCVDFVYVVAAKGQLRNFRELLDGYDDNDDARFWKPYFPPAEDPVAKIAEMLAYKKDLMPSRIAFGPDLIARLEESQRARRIVVLVADPWSLQVPNCRDVMVQFGGRNFWNCVVVVPWHEDDETRQQSTALKDTIERLFFGLRPEAVRSQIRSSKEFVRQLEGALLTAHKQIELFSKFRTVDGTGLRVMPSLTTR